MPDDELPEWGDISSRKDKGDDLTAVEQFIYENEPAGLHSRDWRLSLQAALFEYSNDAVALAIQNERDSTRG